MVVALTVLLLVILALWRVVLYYLGKVEWRRLERVSSRKTFEAIPTESPFDEPKEVAADRAKESIRLHFVNTRRFVLPVLLLVVGALVLIPFSTSLPAAVMSVYLGALTVIVGVAAKPVVENFIAGLVMGFSKVLNIGDTVLYNDNYATVEDISMTHTTLKIWDWRRYVVPNSRMLVSEFLNYSITDLYQWAYVEFWVSYQADLDEVERLAVAAARQSKHFAPHEDPRFWVMETGKEGLKCWVAAWADTPTDAWLLRADVRTALARNFREAGIRPHRYYLEDLPARTSAPTTPSA